MITKPIPEPVTLCAFCGNRPATKLCDAPKGHHRYIGHLPKGESEAETTLTCNRLMCDHCATHTSNGLDFCPDCVERIHTITEKMIGGPTMTKEALAKANKLYDAILGIKCLLGDLNRNEIVKLGPYDTAVYREELKKFLEEQLARLEDELERL